MHVSRNSLVTPAAVVAVLLCGSAIAQTPAKMDADMQKVLDAHAQLGPKPIETLEPGEARNQPTPADAVAKILKDENRKIDPHAGLKVSNSYLADMGNLRLRYYTPENATKDSSLPVIVYFRGGGWVIASLEVYDASAAALARKTNAIVVSVDYPMGPEKKFPAAHTEAVDAYKYVLKNAKDWGGDPGKIAIAGESAGGNLAINTAIAARDQQLPAPRSVISVYPVASASFDSPSKKQYADAKPLNTPMMKWFFSHALGDAQEAGDVRISLVNANLKNLPPITIINAEIDPLRSDGDELTARLKSAGNQVTQRVYSGVAHEFFGMDAVVAKASEAQDFAADQLKRSFSGAKPTN